MLLEPSKPFVDASPAGREEVDEEPEIVHARVPLREDVTLEALEPAEQLVHQAPHLGELAADRARLGRDAFLDSFADLCRQRGLELGCRSREVLETLPRALQRGFNACRVGASLGSLCEALPRALDRVLIHRAQH